MIIKRNIINNNKIMKSKIVAFYWEKVMGLSENGGK